MVLRCQSRKFMNCNGDVSQFCMFIFSAFSSWMVVKWMDRSIREGSVETLHRSIVTSSEVHRTLYPRLLVSRYSVYRFTKQYSCLG